MKKLVPAILMLFFLVVSTATVNSPIKIGQDQLLKANSFGYHPFELEEGVDAMEFEKFFLEKIAPVYSSVEGQEVYLVKGDRGQRTGKYAFMITFTDVATRDGIYLPGGGVSEEFTKATEGTEEIWAQMESYIVGDFSANHTDYYKIQDKE